MFSDSLMGNQHDDEQNGRKVINRQEGELAHTQRNVCEHHEKSLFEVAFEATFAVSCAAARLTMPRGPQLQVGRHCWRCHRGLRLPIVETPDSTRLPWSGLPWQPPFSCY